MTHKEPALQSEWESEFDAMWPNQTKSREELLGLFGQNYQPHTATEAAILVQAENKRQAFKDFIRALLAIEREKLVEAVEAAVGKEYRELDEEHTCEDTRDCHYVAGKQMGLKNAHDIVLALISKKV